MPDNPKHIVVIGGGTGTYTVLSGLKKHPVYLSAIVSMADDGGSTGVLREEFGILPPGDVRRALIALSRQPNRFLVDLFNYRFKEGGVNGHNFGNLILTALERVTGNFERAIEKASELLDVKNGQVIPVTLSKISLVCELEDGSVVRGETNIDIPKHDGTLRVARAWIEPRGRANSKALKAIRDADLIVVGPGDLYTSIIPNFLVPGVRETFIKAPAKKVYVMNLMTKYGETHGFVAEDFLETLEAYLDKKIFDAVLVNSKKPAETLLKKYRKENSFFIDDFFVRPPGARKPKMVHSDFLRSGSLIRHDPDKLAHSLIKLI